LYIKWRQLNGLAVGQMEPRFTGIEGSGVWWGDDGERKVP